MTNNISTNYPTTWCPGCPNFSLLAAVKKAIAKIIDSGVKKEELAMVTGIGCHAKTFDYLNISGIYGLHGRVLPLALGIKLGNPNLTVIGFAGDGDTYAEGMEHFIHSCRYNANFTLIVHDNRAFSLTTGQATPTTEQGYKNKAEPLGELNEPLNPMKLALAAGATFVARVNAKDIEQTSEILEKAIKHKGFSFVEAIQNCIIFNIEDNVDKSIYKIQDNKDDMVRALELANEWSYNSVKEKVPVGIFYQASKPTLEDKWPQLQELKKKKIGWKDVKR